MELRHLKYFVAVAEELHFSKAARRLNISQPPLSQQIAALEDELGLKLLSRDRRNVALTKAGEIFLNRARMILSNTDEAVEEARRIDQGYQGKIIVGFMSAVMLLRITEFLEQFHLASPIAAVDLRQMQSPSQYMAVINGEIDVGFVDIAAASMVNTLDTALLDISLALHEPLVACVNRNHALADCRSVSMKDLREAAFITLTRQSFPTFFDTFLQLCQDAGFNPHIHQQVESMPVAITMAASGFGVAIVPALSQGMHPSSAAFIPIEEHAFVDIYMISRQTNQSALVNRLRAICAANAGQS